MPHRFYIVRHGNTFSPSDIVTRVGGRTDLALSPSGEHQANALAEHFRTTRFDRCLCSPLKRTRRTAELIVQAQASALQMEPAEFLREMDYGPDENKAEADVIARIGLAALEAWETEARLPPGWRLDIKAVKASWHELVNSAPEEGRTLIVTSNGIARFALIAFNLVSEAGSLKLKTGAYGVLQRTEPDRIELTGWNIRP